MTEIEHRQTFTRDDGTEVPRPKRRPRINQRYNQLLTGELKIEDLDDEELIRGQMRTKHGDFRGPHPSIIPWTMHKAAMDAFGQRMERHLIEEIPNILDAMVAIANGSDVTGLRDPKARVAAGTYLLDRILGKTPDKQETQVTVTSRWEEAAAGGRLFVDVDPDTPVLLPSLPHEDGDVVEADVVEPTSSQGEPEVTPTPERPPARPRRKVTGVKL